MKNNTRTISRWPLLSREDYEEEYQYATDNPVYPDELVLPILVDAVDNLPNAVRLVAGGMRLSVELLHETCEPVTICDLPVHVREKVIDRFRMAANAYQRPFNAKQDGTILATYKGANYDISINYITRFYGRDEILTFQARKADDESVTISHS